MEQGESFIMKRILSALFTLALFTLALVIGMIIIFIWGITADAADRIIIIHDPDSRWANHIGERAYSHYFEEQGGNIIRVDRIHTRLKGGRVRIRETRSWWQENKSKGRLEYNRKTKKWEDRD